MAVDSAGGLLDFGAVLFLHPEDHVFTQMLTGWRNQPLCRSYGLTPRSGRAMTRESNDAEPTFSDRIKAEISRGVIDSPAAEEAAQLEGLDGPWCTDAKNTGPSVQRQGRR